MGESNAAADLLGPGTQEVGLPYGWTGPVSEFFTTTRGDWLQALGSHHVRCMGELADPSQEIAWQNSYEVLRQSLADLTVRNPDASTWTIVFEYELPRERGRRPDVVILARGTVLVLEFKDFSVALRAHIDQASAYARDLHHYHAASHDHNVIPFLVLTQSDLRDPFTEEGVQVVSPRALARSIEASVGAVVVEPINPVEWLEAEYFPLPSLISAARSIFRHEPLPHIRRAHSAGIPETLRELNSIAARARARGELHLALVTGVPGAGKTLVGLQFVYAKHFDATDTSKTAVFLSGNGPLVKVLQYVLKSSVFVQDVHGFLKQYGGKQNKRPMEHIWVYDEAQRAWDADRVRGMRGHGTSEPEDFLRIGERMDSWAMMVGLIGEGQQIHLGEERGLSQWNDAIAEMPSKWIVHCASAVAPSFGAAAEVYSNDLLSLTKSLRSHLAEDVQAWVTHLLSGDLARASLLVPKVLAQHFDMYVTRDLGSAKAYVRERYDSEKDKRYGMLASSKAKNLSEFGVENGFTFTRRLREGPWFNDGPESRFSCCSLHDVATEFQCQGLELDFPVVCWGDDLLWHDARWHSRIPARSQARDPHQLRINSYRVLLTRARDGFAVFVPPTATMDSTYAALLSAGLVQMSSTAVNIRDVASAQKGAGS